MIVNKEDVVKAVENMTYNVNLGKSPDIAYAVKVTAETTLDAVYKAIDGVKEPQPANNREAFLKALSELDNEQIIDVMCRNISCIDCPAADACALGGFNSVVEWMKKEGTTVEQFKDVIG